MKKKFALFFSFLLLLDIATKILAIRFIPAIEKGGFPFGGIPIFSGDITFSLNYIVNTGAAWGSFSGYPGVLFFLRLCIIAGLLVHLFRSEKPSFSLSLIVTGAVGNAIDYYLYGHVIDFFHFTFWGYSFPIFNVADSCITLGVMSLLLFSKSRSLQTS